MRDTSHSDLRPTTSKRRRNTNPVFVLDTNIYRRLARREIQLIPQLQTRVRLSHVTYFELVAQLQSSTPDTFEELHGAIDLAYKHARRGFLSQPTDFIKAELFGYQPNSASLIHSRKGLALAARVRRHAQIGQRIKMNDRYYFLTEFQQQRLEFQTEWIRAIDSVKTDFLHHAGVNLQSGRRTVTGHAAQLVNNFVTSHDWQRLYARAVISTLASLEPEAELEQRTTEALCCAAAYMGWILRAAVVDGYNYRAQANDSYDHGQLQYLSKNRIILVTDDKRLLNRVGCSPQASRVITSDVFLGSTQGLPKGLMRL